MARPTQSVSQLSIEKFYNAANKDNMRELVGQFYDENVVFQDPVGKIQGRENLTDYYLHLYKNIKSIRFEIKKKIQQGDELVAFWKMFMKFPGLNYGNEVTVEGVSQFKFKDGKAIYHRDYFDLGEMVYEQIPVFGKIIKTMKSRMAKY